MPFKKKLFQKVRLLYAEDEPELRKRTAAFLGNYFKEVLCAANGQEALELYKSAMPDMLLTDIRMPHLSGIELVQTIRQNDPDIPIIMLTAHSETDLLLEAVKLKLEDYLVKPYLKDDLLHSLANGAKTLPLFSNRIHTFANGAIYIFAKKSVSTETEDIPLTRHESDLLELLICKTGEVVTYEEIEAYVYRGDYMSPDAIKTLIKKLRKKLPPDSIKNIVSIGYQLH